MTPTDRPIPPQLQKLIDAWEANAREAEMPEGACFVEFEEEREVAVREYYLDSEGYPDYRNKMMKGPAWEIACNFERGPILFWFPEQDLWLSQDRWSGDCRPFKTGLVAALSVANMAYTG